jgi:hypothetical protein
MALAKTKADALTRRHLRKRFVVPIQSQPCDQITI